MDADNNILRIKGLTKLYPGVRALDDFSVDIRKGEVHAFIGENGAGKSTLIKAIAGAIRPDAGVIQVEGTDYSELSPSLTKKLGIEVIYQEFNLVPSLSAAENVFLGEKTGSRHIVNIKRREKLATALFKQLNVEINPSKPVRDLSPAYQQIVEIAKAVSRDVKILIMDEPTAPLTVSEVGMLFHIVRQLREKGVTILYISHRLEELFEIGDRVTVMRDGVYVATKNIAEITRSEMISLMAGHAMNESYPARKAAVGEELLRVEHLTGNGVSDINFTLHKGEMLGFAGLVGAGRTELMRVLYGVARLESGQIFIEGTPVVIRSSQAAIRQGIGLIPEDRKGQGVFLPMSIQWNTVINNIKNISHFGVVDKKKEKEITKRYGEKLRIKTPSFEQKVENLSGGNQQKVVIAKTLAANSKILIFDEPTRGIDVGAKQEIYKLMNELAESGCAIIIVSSEMPELLGMSDRIVVIAEGRQAGIVEKERFSQNYVLDLASGGQQTEEM